MLLKNKSNFNTKKILNWIYIYLWRRVNLLLQWLESFLWQNHQGKGPCVTKEYYSGWGGWVSGTLCHLPWLWKNHCGSSVDPSFWEFLLEYTGLRVKFSPDPNSILSMHSFQVLWDERSDMTILCLMIVSVHLLPSLGVSWDPVQVGNLHLVGDEMSILAAKGQRSCGDSISVGGNTGWKLLIMYFMFT